MVLPLSLILPPLHLMSVAVLSLESALPLAAVSANQVMRPTSVLTPKLTSFLSLLKSPLPLLRLLLTSLLSKMRKLSLISLNSQINPK